METLFDRLRSNPEREIDKQKEEQEKQLAREVAATYERYAADLAILQKTNPKATMFGVSFDASAAMLTTAPINVREIFKGIDYTGYEFGQRPSPYIGHAFSDVTATIRKQSVPKFGIGKKVDMYTLELTRNNVECKQFATRDEENSTLLKLDVTQGLSTVVLNSIAGQEDTGLLERGIDTFHRAFPKTEA